MLRKWEAHWFGVESVRVIKMSGIPSASSGNIKEHKNSAVA